MITNLGFTYEEVKVTTDVGYIDTHFHVTGTIADGPFTPTKPSVVFTHGMGGDSTEWAATLNPDKHEPMALQLARRGFDIWMANNSANTISTEHISLTQDDPEFWQLDWVDYGTYSTTALVSEVQKRNGGKKVAYVGHSQGTSQAFAGLATRPDFYDEHVSTMVLFGPCTVVSTKYFTSVYTKENWDWLQENNMYVLSGPNWEDHDKQFIIDNAPQSLVDNMPLYQGIKYTPIQAHAHYAQTALSGRFQEYMADWFDVEGPPRSEIMDVGRVAKVNLALYVGLWDDTCPGDNAAQLAKELGAETVTHYVVAPWQGHVPWGLSAAPWLIDDLEAILQTNQ